MGRRLGWLWTERGSGPSFLRLSGVGRDKKVDTKDKGMVDSTAAEKGPELWTDQTDKGSRESITLHCFIRSG